jgi:hypothetical protein
VRSIFPYWVKQLFPQKSPPARRRRTARPRLEVESFETRIVPAVFAFGASGQLVVGTTATTDTVTIDQQIINNLPFTVVNGSAAFADSSITNGIHIQSGFAQLDILATAKPLTYDGAGFTTVVLGKPGDMQGIRSPMSIGSQDREVILDDSTDPTGQDVTIDTSGGTETVVGLARVATISFPKGDNLGDLQVKGGPGVNTFNIPNNSNILTLDTGSGSDTVNLKATSGHTLTIQGQAGFDLVNIGNNGSLQGIQAEVDVDAGPFIGGSNRVQLTVDDSADTSARNVSMGGAPSTPGDFVIAGLIPGDPFDIPFTDPIEYGAAHTQFVEVEGGSGSNTYTVTNTIPTGTTSLDTGTGNDPVFVQGTSGQLIIDSQGFASNNQRLTSINVGNNGSLLTIGGAITISNQHSLSSLTLDGSADLVNRTFTLSATPTVGLIQDPGFMAPISYTPSNLGDIHIIGGQGSEQYLIQSTAGTPPITIDGLGSNVRFIVGNSNLSLDDIHNPLTLNGGAGFDQLIVNDTGAATGHFYSNDGSQITRDFGAITIDYSGMDVVQLNESPLTPHFLRDPFFPAATDLALNHSLRAGQRATLSGRLIDADPREVLSLTVNWGDGSAPMQSTPNRAPFHLTHRYEAPGTYEVLVTWRHSVGRHRSRHLTLTVRPAGHGEPPHGRL